MSNLEFQRVYEFLSRLRLEFEPRRAQQFSLVPRVSIMGALTEICAEYTRLCGVGLLEVPFVLAIQTPTTPPAAPAPSRLDAPPLLPTPSGGGRAHTHCGYCNRDDHLESDCFKKRHMCGSSSRTHAPTPTPSAVSLTKQDITRLKRLLAASDYSSFGSVGSMTDAFGTETTLGVVIYIPVDSRFWSIFSYVP